MSRPDGGWRVSENAPPLYALLECLVKGLLGTKEPSEASAFVSLLGFGSPGEFDRLGATVQADDLQALRAEALWPGYASYCREVVAPALHQWVAAADPYEGLRGLSVLLDYTPSRALALEYFDGLLTCARRGTPGYTRGATTATWLLEPSEREGVWSRLLEASMPDAGWTLFALRGLATWATEKSVPLIKRVLQEEYDSGSDITYLRGARRNVYLAGMRLLAKLENDPEHAPPEQFAGNEQDEMWKPGGRLAELLKYWRETP